MSERHDAGRGTGPGERLGDLAFRALMGALRLLPYRLRIPLSGAIFSRVVAPAAGYRRRILQNLDLVLPGLDPAERHRIARAVADNTGRAIAELYSGAEFIRRIAADDPLTGPGVATLDAARAEGRPVILATAHFGNYDAMRVALVARGFRVGAVYRPMNNAAFNRHYIRAMETIARPLFPRGRQGMAEMLRFLRSGGFLALGFDQHVSQGARLDFFGRPASTALSAAELALKYDAPLVPVYGIRRGDGLGFDVVAEAPVPRGTATEMTQTLNAGLERLVRDHMDQWFWIHRRWK